MQRLKSKEIKELFQFMERILEENPIEYLDIGYFGIKGMNVLDFLKNTKQYEDSEYINTRQYLTNHYFSDDYHRSDIKEEELILYSFSDLEGYFTKEDKLTATGYELASSFLTTDLCSDSQYIAFLNVVLAYADAVELSENDKKKWNQYMKKI